MIVTLCIDCDNVAKHTRSKPQSQWLCLAHKRVEGGSFIDPTWKNDPPYLYCKFLNGGACPLWTERENEDSS